MRRDSGLSGRDFQGVCGPPRRTGWAVQFLNSYSRTSPNHEWERLFAPT